MKASVVNIWNDGDSEIRVAVTVPVTFTQWLDYAVRKIVFQKSNPKLVASARATAIRIVQTVLSKESK